MFSIAKRLEIVDLYKKGYLIYRRNYNSKTWTLDNSPKWEWKKYEYRAYQSWEPSTYSPNFIYTPAHKFIEIIKTKESFFDKLYKKILNLFMPLGIIITTRDNVNPAAYYGGEWRDVSKEIFKVTGTVSNGSIEEDYEIYESKASKNTKSSSGISSLGRTIASSISTYSEDTYEADTYDTYDNAVKPTSFSVTLNAHFWQKVGK